MTKEQQEAFNKLFENTKDIDIFEHINWKKLRPKMEQIRIESDRFMRFLGFQ